MAGGSGTRLWPASTSRRPKQFLNLPRQASGQKADSVKGSSFFQAALERA
ncbi:MAG: sugar phosphate nucleotidyltransferase, partial [Treponema sp.]|nr:sugar phosphate nucleotidyltransferase [Treponema sp.]